MFSRDPEKELKKAHRKLTWDFLLGIPEEMLKEKAEIEFSQVFRNDPDFTLNGRYKRILEVKTSETELDEHDKFLLQLLSSDNKEDYVSYEEKVIDRIKSYKKYIRNQIEKYKRSAAIQRILLHLSQLVILVGATVVPFILNISEVPKIVPTIISGIVALMAALANFYKFGTRSQNSLLAAEALRRELNLYSSQLGKYAVLGPSKALEYFIEQTESLILVQVQKSTSLENSAESQLTTAEKGVPRYH